MTKYALTNYINNLAFNREINWFQRVMTSRRLDFEAKYGTAMKARKA